MYQNQDYPQYKYKKESTSLITKFIAAFIRSAVRFGRDFCKETSIHGFNHIAAPRRHLLERFLWLCVTAAAIWGAVDISLGQWQRYNENPTVVTLEKDFRTWRFNYPAITVCSADRVNPTKLPEVIKNTWNVSYGDEKYEYYSRFVATVANSDLFHLQGYHDFRDDESLNVDLMKLAVDVMPDLQMKPTWSDGSNPPWLKVITEAGACYVANCLAIADNVITKLNPNETKMIPISCKYSSLSCYVILEVSSKTDFYTHSPYNVLDLMVPPNRVITTLNRVVELSVTQTGCGKAVKELSPHRRQCLFTDEPTEPGRQVYSTNTCRLSCRNKLAIKLCGCKPFYYFYEAEGELCTPAGMACLSEHAQRLASNNGERCACAQQCVDSVFKEVSIDDKYWEKGPFANRGAVRFTVLAPRTRYTREIVFHFQDLVVSFGGAAGLFLGASFISFVEIFYFLSARVMRSCIGDDQKTSVVEVKPKKVRLPYEAMRIMELTRILEDQKTYGRKLYPF